MKYAISFFFVLLLAIGGLLFFQFQVFSDKIESGEGEFSYTQEIEIEYRGDSLDIRQHFRQLPNQTIVIKWPNQATNPDCFIESENACQRLSEDKTKFTVGEAKSQSLSYVIPLDGGLKSKLLMKDIFASLKNGTVTYSTVHISTDNKISGQWITGLPLVGQQSLTLVNYSMFSGKGNVRELYWQKEPMSIHQANDVISLYTNKSISKQMIEKLKKIQFLNDDHISIVQGENLTKEQGERILFLNDITVDGLNQSVIVSQVDALYDFQNSPNWIKELFASFITGAKFDDSHKSTKIKNELVNTMTDIQIESFVQKIKELESKQITPSVLDEILTEIFSNNTKFFSLNVTSKEVFPLSFSDERKLIVNNKYTEDVQTILQDGLIYYSADKILNLLGYEVSEGPNGYYVKNSKHSYRFPEDFYFYVYNEKRYNTVSFPIIEIAGNKYIEESWLQRLFFVEIEKTEHEIIISPNLTLQ